MAWRGGRVAVVYGTRPEIIKLAGIIRRLGSSVLLVHTGQHYDREMSDAVAADMGLPSPHARLAVGGSSRAMQIGMALTRMNRLLVSEDVTAVVVQGDSNTTLAGALAANALGLPLIHVEAGLRSYDRAMPEEHNRVVVDHLSDLLCAPTLDSVTNLAAEGIRGDHVVATGNTVVEAVRLLLPAPDDRLLLLTDHGLKPDRYLLATIHRPENTDDPWVLQGILEQLGRLPLPVVLPLHPRTAAAIRRFDLTALLKPIQVIPPCRPATFLSLAAHAAVLVSDSGGMQEECTVLGRPLLVVRRSTERPEALTDFARLVPECHGLQAAVEDVLARGQALLDRLAGLPSPFGDETAAERIVDLMAERYGRIDAPGRRRPVRPSMIRPSVNVAATAASRAERVPAPYPVEGPGPRPGRRSPTWR